MSRFVDTDVGYRQIKRLLSDAKAVTVSVGIRGAENSDLAEYAAANEFGTDTIPERSFLRTTVDENAAKYVKVIGKGIKRVLAGQARLHDEFDRLGLRVVRDVKRKIRAIKDPPNAPATVARKGVNNPLIDTGRMRQSIDYVVEEER